MKIALCLYKYFPYGGLQRDFLNIAKVLLKKGHAVRVYTRSWSGSDCPSDIELILVPTSSITNHGKNLQYYHWIHRHLLEHPVDRVVGFNKMPNLDVYYGADVCYAEKVAKEKNWLYKLGARYRHYKRFEELTVGRGLKTKLMIITPTQQKEFQKHYNTEDSRFYLLPPGISKDRKYTNFSHESRTKFRNTFQLTDSDFLILQIGSDFKRKGVDRSILALASLPEKLKEHCFLYVVGQDKPDDFINLAKKHGIEQNVKFFGGRDDIPDFIAAADLFLHPARSENTGTVILEALVGGLPEIVTATCGYAPYVIDANSGYVINEPFNQKTFNDTFLTALSSDKLAVLRKNACTYADNQDLYSLPEKAAEIILG